MDEVEDLLDDGWAVAEIAAWADCSARSVRNIANGAGIDLPQARRRAARLDVLHHDSEALRGWLDAGETASSIAHRLAVEVAEVRAALEAHSLTAPASRPRRYPQLYEPDWLAEQLRVRRPLREIAAQVGCSTAAVRRAITTLGITDRRAYAERRFPQLHDKAWLRRRYIDERKSSTAIAAELGCGNGATLRALHRAAIDVRSGPHARRYPQLHDAAWLRRRAINERASTAQLVAELGCSRTSVRRALRRAGIHRRPSSTTEPQLNGNGRRRPELGHDRP